MHDGGPPEACSGKLFGVELPLFEQVADGLHALVGAEVGPWRHRAHRRGIKVWFGGDRPGRAHYEAQLVSRRLVDGVDGTALEIGFHAEHGDPEANRAELSRLAATEAIWRNELGDAPVAGEFLGDTDGWLRVSETWLDPDLDDPELAFEVASRLTDYLDVLEPLRRADGHDGPGRGEVSRPA